MRQLLLLCSVAVLCGAALSAQEAFRFAGPIMYDPENCILTWKVERGTMSGEKFRRVGKPVKLSVRLHDATMTDGKQTHRLSDSEQQERHAILKQVLSGYAAESTQWFFDPKVRERYWDHEREKDAAPAAVKSGRAD